MKLYAHPFSSYCQKVLIALYENDTPFEFRMLAPGDERAAAEHAALWPLKRMPVLVDDGRIIRYTQDCYPVYGTKVRAFEVTEVTTMRYHEQALAARPVSTGNPPASPKSPSTPVGSIGGAAPTMTKTDHVATVAGIAAETVSNKLN